MDLMSTPPFPRSYITSSLATRERWPGGQRQIVLKLKLSSLPVYGPTEQENVTVVFARIEERS